jgi:glycine hydroxymethyltransferase
MDRLFAMPLNESDDVIYNALQNELNRQQSQIELIASENLVSQACLAALGSIITNKTVEGYPGGRFHGGAEFADVIETEAIKRCKNLFECKYANVQPHSGSQANQAVFFATVSPGDTVLSMSLTSGGHLSHGAAPNMSGRWFNAVNYTVSKETGLIDYNQIEQLAQEYQPKLIIAGGSAYPREIKFERIRKIADQVEALFLVDMAHFAGLVAAGVHPSPVPIADIVTLTTTKTLRGPRGGVILTNREDLAKKINAAVFPGFQGSIHLQVIAAKAVAFGEALKPEYKAYGHQVRENARKLAHVLQNRGFNLIGEGTDTHLVLVNVGSKGLTGKEAEDLLGAVNITCNKNPIPTDLSAPSKWSGIRLGTSAATTRGFNNEDFTCIGNLIADVLESTTKDEQVITSVIEHVRFEVAKLCAKYPVYDFAWPTS